jgi:hypothetical protein
MSEIWDFHFVETFLNDCNHHNFAGYWDNHSMEEQSMGLIACRLWLVFLLGFVFSLQGFAQIAPINTQARAQILRTAGLLGGDENSLERRMSRLKQALENLKLVLDVRPDQEMAFQTFGQNLQLQLISARERMAAAGQVNKNMRTPERMEWQEEQLARQLELMKQRHVIVKSFYAVLDERQRKVFDLEYQRFMNDVRQPAEKI